MARLLSMTKRTEKKEVIISIIAGNTVYMMHMQQSGIAPKVNWTFLAISPTPRN